MGRSVDQRAGRGSACQRLPAALHSWYKETPSHVYHGGGSAAPAAPPASPPAAAADALPSAAAAAAAAAPPPPAAASPPSRRKYDRNSVLPALAPLMGLSRQPWHWKPAPSQAATTRSMTWQGTEGGPEERRHAHTFVNPAERSPTKGCDLQVCRRKCVCVWGGGGGGGGWGGGGGPNKRASLERTARPAAPLHPAPPLPPSSTCCCTAGPPAGALLDLAPRRPR